MDASRPLGDIDPSQYIEKVNLVTGEVVVGEISPDDLLVRSHRDHHPADIQARRFTSLLMRQTGNERLVLRKMRELRRLGHKTSASVAKILRRDDPAQVAELLFGIKERKYFYRFKKPAYSSEEIAARIARLRHEAEEKTAAVRSSGEPCLRLFLTGGTGFIGKEILWQAARDPDVAEVVVLIRPKKIRDPKSREKRLVSPEERGAELVRELRFEREADGRKLRFIAGDIETPGLGISAADRAGLEHRVTHVIHSAASVTFDDPYEASFRANVLGTRRVLDFSHGLQTAPGSPFIAHLGIETSYIHGRRMGLLAREDAVTFPVNFYNNFYELTKAMATFETERFMLDRGLRLLQLCPAVVIGESAAGNNRGDAKVVNAPVNLFGRVRDVMKEEKGSWMDRSKLAMLGRMASVFPADPSAQINLVPVDRVVAGVVAALKSPRAIGERIHLATDKRITSAEIARIVEEEIGTGVRLAEPTMHRNFTQPVLTRILSGLGQDVLARKLEQFVTVFGNYGEWGQPIHEVGKDVHVLGLSPERPDARDAFRMLCRHNRYVLEFGKVRDQHEISRRERIWRDFVGALEGRTKVSAGAMPAPDFHRAVAEGLELDAFELWADQGS